MANSFEITGGQQLHGEIEPQGAKKRSITDSLCRITNR